MKLHFKSFEFVRPLLGEIWGHETGRWQWLFQLKILTFQGQILKQWHCDHFSVRPMTILVGYSTHLKGKKGRIHGEVLI